MMDEKAEIQKAENLYSVGKLGEAISLFKAVIEKHPDSYESYNNMGVIYYEQGEINKAEYSFRKALSIKGDYQDALLNISDHYQKQYNFTAAAEYLEKAANNDGKDINICNRLATLYFKIGNKEKANNIIKKSLSTKPDQTSIKDILTLLESNNAPLQTNDKGIKILHVMILDKFLPPYIDFIDKHFGKTNHQYVFVDKERYEYGLTPDHHVEFINTIDGIFITLLDYMKKADKIILHGLWRTEVDILLYFNQALLKKCYWVMWGGDFYFPKQYSLIKKHIIRNMGHAITSTVGDFEIAKQYYGTQAKHYKCFSYVSNAFKDYSYLLENKRNICSNKVILIGNSADPTNNHLDILDKISILKNDNIEVICPLSYGNSEYAKKVIHAGRTIFGENFKPLINFIPLLEYAKILVKVDMAIFAHKRQQGLGNLITLLGLGKKVYLRDDITTWVTFKEMEIKIYSFNGGRINFDFPEKYKSENVDKIKENYSYEKLIFDWEKIFNE
jgi:dTDP-N-acetylfucosamine:lipid II N-acetylfucosaminyltransferase